MAIHNTTVVVDSSASANQVLDQSSGNPGGSSSISVGVELRRMNTTMEKVIDCSYRLTHDRGKELDYTFNDRFQGEGDRYSEMELLNLKCKLDSRFQTPMVSDASRPPLLPSPSSSNYLKISQQNLDFGFGRLEAKIQEQQNFFNQARIGDEGTRDSNLFVTSEVILEKFNELKQESTVNEYLLRFDELKNSILASKYWILTEEFLVSKFTHGLKLHIRNSVEMFYPITLFEAITLAKLQEGYLARINAYNGSINSVVVEHVKEPPEKLPDVLVEKVEKSSPDVLVENVEKPHEVKEEQKEDYEDVDYSIEAYNAASEKVENEIGNVAGDNFLEEVLSNEEPANACFGNVFGVADASNGTDFVAGVTLVESDIEDQNEDIVPELDQANGAVLNLVGPCDSSKLNSEYIAGIEEVQAFDCKRILVELKVSKERLMNVIVNDPFYDSISSTLFNEKMQFMLTVGLDVFMVEMRCLLVVGCEVCIVVMRFQVMRAIVLGLQWLRKGVG